jgi:hypothetical protein
VTALPRIVGCMQQKRITNTGIFVGQWGSLGTGDGQFNQAIGVAVNADGNGYVSDFNNPVQKFACP